MKPINMSTEVSQDETPLRLDVIPAKLHDVAEQVYGDNLYSYYNISSETNGTEIDVSIMATDLVKHTTGNGVKGYWVGIGINEEILQDSSIFVGWGTPVDSDLVDLATPDGEQEENEQLYSTFYFNAESASKYENKAYVVVNRAGIHYHYNLDLSQVNMKTEEVQLDEIGWSKISVQALKDNYLYGIDLSDANGNPLPEGLFAHYMNAAIDYLQGLLDIVISDTEFTERHDYIRNDYQNWGFIQLDHNPIKEIKSIKMMYGNKPSVDIPLDWVQLDKLTGQITLFPSAGSANSLIIGQTGLLFGFQSQWDYAPQLWEVEYVAGIDDSDKSMPLSLLSEAIYKRCSCGVLNVWGRRVSVAI